MRMTFLSLTGHSDDSGHERHRCGRDKFDEAVGEVDRSPALQPSIEPIQGEDMKKVTEPFAQRDEEMVGL